MGRRAAAVRAAQHAISNAGATKFVQDPEISVTDCSEDVMPVAGGTCRIVVSLRMLN